MMPMKVLTKSTKYKPVCAWVTKWVSVQILTFICVHRVYLVFHANERRITFCIKVVKKLRIYVLRDVLHNNLHLEKRFSLEIPSPLMWKWKTDTWQANPSAWELATAMLLQVYNTATSGTDKLPGDDLDRGLWELFRWIPQSVQTVWILPLSNGYKYRGIHMRALT